MAAYLMSVVVPVYKEENNIHLFVDRMTAVMDHLGCDYEIIFCLDPSPDHTYEVIQKEIAQNDRIKVIQFARRFGQPTATLAGIYACKGDVCVVIDVDLQDPPELIEEMVSKWKEGYNVVYAQRRSRKGETMIKKFISKTGYWLINKYSEVRIPVNTGDFRLIDRKVIDELQRIREHHGFLRGMVASVGFKQVAVQYDRDERASGEGNYNRLTGSWRIGLNGLFCYSYWPLEFISAFGAIYLAISSCLLLIYLVQLVVTGTSFIPLSLLILMLISSTEIFFLAVMGQYIGRIYEEIKNRPRYIVDRTENMTDTQVRKLNEMRSF